MKEPDKHSTRPDLPSGSYTIPGQNPFTNSLQYVGNGAHFPSGSVVVASLEDPNAILPLTSWLHVLGWIDQAGHALVAVNVEGAGVNLSNSIKVNWMILPPGGTVSAP